MSFAKHKAKIAPKASKKRNSRKKDENGETAKTRILHAAMDVFSSHPYKVASIRMIAEQADVDHPLIHYYFNSKEQLFETVAARIYEEFQEASLALLDGLEQMDPIEGFSVLLDRILDYSFEHPEPLQLILLNMVQIGSEDEIPGLNYVSMHLEQTRLNLEGKFPLGGPRSEIEMFVHCFQNLLISLLGGRSRQAKVLNMDPESAEYRAWVKNTLLAIFTTWLEKLTRTER